MACEWTHRSLTWQRRRSLRRPSISIDARRSVIPSPADSVLFRASYIALQSVGMVADTVCTSLSTSVRSMPPYHSSFSLARSISSSPSASVAA
eukprot:8818229-Alexandrium_andersonii.AAC.1